MTTSGITTGTATVSDVVTDALRELQELAANETIGNSDLALGIKRLNWMLKDWQNDGFNLWRQESVDIVWPADTASQYVDETTPSAVQDILSLAYVGTYERQLTPWTFPEYVQIPNKASPGMPTSYSVVNEVDGPKVYIWPVPTEEITLRAIISRTIEDVTDGAETLDVPQKYTRTVIVCLAAELARAFGKVSDPNAVVTIREASRLYQIMRAADRPASYIFEPSGGRYYGR